MSEHLRASDVDKENREKRELRKGSERLTRLRSCSCPEIKKDNKIKVAVNIFYAQNEETNVKKNS